MVAVEQLQDRGVAFDNIGKNIADKGYGMRERKIGCLRVLLIGMLVSCSACAQSRRQQELAFSGDGRLFRNYSPATIPELFVKTRHGVAFPSFSLNEDCWQEYIFANLPQNNEAAYFIRFVPDAGEELPPGWRIDFALIDDENQIILQDIGSDCWSFGSSFGQIHQYVPDGRKQHVSRPEYSYSPEMRRGSFPQGEEAWSEEWQKKLDEWHGGFYPQEGKSYRLKVHFVPANENASTNSIGMGHFEIRQLNFI